PGQLAELLGQPGHGGVPSPGAVALPVGPGHQLLELFDQQEPTRRTWGGDAARLSRLSTALTHHRTSPGVSNGPSAPRYDGWPSVLMGLTCSGLPGRAQCSSTALSPDSSTTANRTWAGVDPGQWRTTTACGVASTSDSSGARSTSARTGTAADPPLDRTRISPSVAPSGARDRSRTAVTTTVASGSSVP